MKLSVKVWHFHYFSIYSVEIYIFNFRIHDVSLNILKNYNTKLALDKVLVIGDSLETDILGANNNKLNSLLITNGIHKHELINSNNYEVYKNSIDKLCKKYSAFPNYIIKDFIF